MNSSSHRLLLEMIWYSQGRFNSLTSPVDLTPELRASVYSSDDLRKRNLENQYLREHLTKLGLLEEFDQIEKEIKRDTGEVLGLTLMHVFEWTAKKLDEKVELVPTN